MAEISRIHFESFNILYLVDNASNLEGWSEKNFFFHFPLGLHFSHATSKVVEFFWKRTDAEGWLLTGYIYLFQKKGTYLYKYTEIARVAAIWTFETHISCFAI